MIYVPVIFHHTNCAKIILKNPIKLDKKKVKSWQRANEWIRRGRQFYFKYFIFLTLASIIKKWKVHSSNCNNAGCTFIVLPSLSFSTLLCIDFSIKLALFRPFLFFFCSRTLELFHFSRISSAAFHLIGIYWLVCFFIYIFNLHN